jgi:rod shape-determining protein MreC
MKKILIFIYIIIFFIFSINRLFFFKNSFVERSFAIIKYPIILSFSNITNFIKSKFSYSDIENKYINLKNNYEDLLKKYVELNETERFYNKTKEIIEFKSRYELDGAVLSRIISKNFSSHEHSFLINRGKKDSIKEDMVVIYKLQILGKISQVYDFYSKVICITDKRCNISSFTNTTYAQGITAGTNIINKCSLNYVNYISKVIKNDLVFCSGQGKVFPEGFCLGTIKECFLRNDEVSYNITLETIVDFNNLEFCVVTDCSKINLF